MAKAGTGFKKGDSVLVDFRSPLGQADATKAVAATVETVHTHKGSDKYAGQLTVKDDKGKSVVIADCRVIS